MNLNTPNWVKRVATIILLLLVANKSHAIDTLSFSLDEIILKALSNSKYVEQYHLNLKEKEIQVEQTKIELLPKVNLRASASYATNMPIYDRGILNKPSQHDVIHYLYDTGADFYLNLYNGHRDVIKIKSSKLEKEIANIDWLESNAKIKMDVCNLYLELMRGFSHKNLIEKDIVDQLNQLQEIKNLYKAGVVLYSDVLRIELELSKRELLLIQIKNDIKINVQKLQLITGIQEDIVPSDKLVETFQMDFQTLLQSAIENAFSLQRSEQEVSLKNLNIKNTKSNYLPEIGLTGTFTFANPQIFLYPYNDSWYNLGIVGLKMNFPISNFYLNKNLVRSSRVSYEKEKVKHHEEEDILKNQLMQAFLDYNLALEQKKICIKNIDLAKENVRIIKNRYFQSAALITDLLDADMQHLTTQFELESAKIAIQKQYYLIEFLKGTI